MSRGRSAAELQARGCRARIRTWTNRGNSSARYRVTPRGSGGEKGIRTLAPAHLRRPTWVATRPLQPDLGTSPRRRESESNAHVRSYPTSVFETVAPANGRSLQVVNASWSRRVRIADFLDVGEALCRLSYGPMTAARVMPCRGGGARSITRPSEPSDRRETGGTRGRTRTSDEPGVGSRRSAAELRACGRRDRDRTDGLLCFRQALYAC
jgi:hypothetical protein